MSEDTACVEVSCDSAACNEKSYLTTEQIIKYIRDQQNKIYKKLCSGYLCSSCNLAGRDTECHLSPILRDFDTLINYLQAKSADQEEAVLRDIPAARREETARPVSCNLDIYDPLPELPVE